MGALVNMGVEVAEARECWKLRGKFRLGLIEVLHAVIFERPGMYAAILLILYEILSLEEVLDGLGDCEGVWNVEVVSLLSFNEFRFCLTISA